MAKLAAPPAVSSARVVMIIPPLEGEREALAMENLLQACAIDEPFALELYGTARAQYFLLRTESEQTLVTLVQQVQAQYPQAKILRMQPTVDPLLLAPGEHGLIGEVALLGESWKPIKTFWEDQMTEPGTDPVPGILSAMEPLSPDEHIICQIVLARAPDDWASRYVRKTVEHPLTEERDKAQAAARGASAGGAKSDGLLILLLLLGFGAVARGYLWYREGAWLPLFLFGAAVVVALVIALWWWLHQARPIYDMQLVATKLLRVGFYAQVRVIVITRKPQATEAHLRAHLARMELAYRQYNLASANGFFLKRVQTIEASQREAHTLFLPSQAFPYHSLLLQWLHGGRSKDVLNAREVSGMYHLPQAEADVPLVQRLPTKQIMASPEIARQMQQSTTGIPPVYLGTSTQRGHTVQVFLPEAALLSNKFAVAGTRRGKSTLIELLTAGVMVPQRPGSGLLQPGVCIVDPHGDLCEDCLHLVPAERAHDVILIALSDTDHPVGINPLDAGLGFTPDQAIANVMNSFKKAWFEYWGPRMAFYLSAVLRTLFYANRKKCAAGKRAEQYTLLDVNPMLLYADYARAVISELDTNDAQEMELLAWWRDTYFKLNPTSNFKNEVISPILSKMGVFAEKQVLRRIVGQPISTVDIASAVTKGSIVLISLSSKDLEDDAVAILGATLVNLLHRAIQAQSTLPLAHRRPVFLGIDEFQAIPGADYEKLLSEDGKYGCWMMLATQTLKRLDTIRDGLLDLVLSNCEQLFAFSVSASDAKVLEEELHKRVKPEHIMSQPRLQCYARLVLPDHPLQIFSLTLERPASWQRSPEAEALARRIRAANRGRYLEATEVEDRLARHTRRYLDLDLYASKLQSEVQHAAKAKTAQEEAQKREEQRQRDLLAAQNTQLILPDMSGMPMPMATPTATTQPGGNGGASVQNGERRKNHSRSKRGKNGGGSLPSSTSSTNGNTPAN